MEDTTLLEDLEDLVGQLQMGKIDDGDVIESLKAIVRYYNEQSLLQIITRGSTK